MTAPAVSVTMPYYNNRATLPRAIASLVGQTHEDWELVLVDDGSADHPEKVVEQAADRRIRLVRLPENRGRGQARQVALDESRGEYISMLDADDWYYSTHLASLLGVLSARPELALASTGFSIADANGRLSGVRGASGVPGEIAYRPPMTRLGRPAVAHAASMYRGSVARALRYNQSLSVAEDMDFLLQMLLHWPHAVLPTASYVYNEQASVSLEKMRNSMRADGVTFAAYRASHPIQSHLRIAESLAKELVYRVAFAVGHGEWLVHQRSGRPTREQLELYDREYALVTATMHQVFAMGHDVDPA